MTATSTTPSRTATAQVHEAIKQRILEGRYRPHEFIREAAVAAELDVSRTPVREALRELVSEGWLEAMPHQGARVCAWTEEDAQEVFELRLVLEPMAVRTACRQIDAETLAGLHSLADRMEALTSCREMSALAHSELASLNHQFHRVLIQAGGNQRLAQILEGVVRTSVIRRNFSSYDREALLRSMRHHREMLCAIEAGNGAWAESVMRAHLLASRDLHLSVSGNADDGTQVSV